jgi:hypothetical protein
MRGGVRVGAYQCEAVKDGEDTGDDASRAMPSSDGGGVSGSITRSTPVGWVIAMVGCKGKLPLSVFLVINDNPYGLMFLLSFL